MLQLSGFYDYYQWGRVCFQSKQLCFGTKTSHEDVTESNEGDSVCINRKYSFYSFGHLLYFVITGDMSSKSLAFSLILKTFLNIFTDSIKIVPLD